MVDDVYQVLFVEEAIGRYFRHHPKLVRCLEIYFGEGDWEMTGPMSDLEDRLEKACGVHYMDQMVYRFRNAGLLTLYKSE